MTQIKGELLNAADPGKDNVFDGYVVEIDYLVQASHDGPPAYRDASDRFELGNGSNVFSFDLPDPQELALEKDLRIVVRTPSGAEAAHQAILLARVVREPRVIELRVERIEPPKRVTPVSLHGQVLWKGDRARTDGFAGIRIKANYWARQEGLPDFVAQSAAAVLDTNQFAIPLPNQEELKGEPVRVEVKYPTGETAALVPFTLEQLRREVEIEIAPPVPHTVNSDPRAEDAKLERLKGKVIDIEGRRAVSNKQVILWGIRSGSTTAKPIVVTATDGYGNFSSDRPKESFRRAFATVAGTLNSTVEAGVGIDLEILPAAPDDEDGRLPKFVYIAVSLPSDAGHDDPCACEVGSPRQPDPEDLVRNSDAYSQDIGLNCVNFTTPNRTLEEFTYTMVVRTTDPDIKGTTLSDLDHRAGAYKYLIEHMTDLAGMKAPSAPLRPLAASTAAAPAIKSVAALKISDLLASSAAAPANKSVAALKISDFLKYVVPFGERYKTVPARAELNAANSVDWDSTPTFYQATNIAHGHILHYKQIWKADGYSLGDLVYSLPLAPGQKKQVVIFDWDRTEYGRRDEDTHEDEALDAYLSHNRDIIDITRGNLTEHMSGGSTSHVSGEAGGVGGGIGALLGPVMIGVAGGYSASSGSSSSSAWQDSSRDTAANGLNQLRDMIQQGASAVRNQRSTVVQTARQTERFRVETEVIANHNHCHAITVEYFEVLRHYAIEQKLAHVQECLFIPLLMSEFDEGKVVRWKDLLRPALRDPNPRNLFRLATGGYSARYKPLADGFDAIERRWNNYAGTDFPALTYAAEEVLDLSGDIYITLSLNRPRDKNDESADNPIDDIQWQFYAFFLGWTPSFIFNNYFAKRVQQERDRIFEEQIAPRIAEGFIDTLKFLAIDKDGNPHSLGLDTTLVSRYQRDAMLYISVRPTQGQLGVTREQIAKLVIYTDYDLSQSANSRIIVRSGNFRYRTAHFDGVLYRNDAINNDLKSVSLLFPGFAVPSDNVTLYTPLSTEELRNPRKEDEELSRRLLTHLNGNIEAYHKVIWLRMDPDRRYMLLDGFEAPNANGKSVASVVENRVIGIAGNSLIMPVAPGYKLDPSYDFEPELNDDGEPRRDERGNIIFKRVDLLEHYQPLTPIPPFRVSVPTRGVFAEAIMGACNSCEKKDETRFWRWEESPNPDEPTPINPIQTTPPARTEPGKLEPTSFPAPMVNIQNAPAAPEPGATLSGTLGLLGKSGLFPDLTGLDQTQKNALQAMLSNEESAKHYADKASELAVQAANLRSGSSTIEGIKKSMDDGTLDKDSGKKLIEDAYRAQISGKTSSDQAANTANNSPLGKAAADAVKSGRQVTASQTHPDGTQVSVDQKAQAKGEGTGTAAIAGHDLTGQEVASLIQYEFSNGRDINEYFRGATGKDFVDWFNSEHANKGAFDKKFISGNNPFNPSKSVPMAVVKTNFEAFWDNLNLIFEKPTVNLIEFLTLMTSPINEINGNLVSMTEGDYTTPLNYYFEKNSKNSYNLAPLMNMTATECFNNVDYIAEHEKNADGTKKKYAQLAGTAGPEWATAGPYPPGFSTNTSVTEAGFIREADFYKFRGRGVIQITFRDAYRRLISFVLDYPDAGASATIKKYRDDWHANMADADRKKMIERIAYKTTNEHWDELFGDIHFLASSVKVFSEYKGGFLKLANTPQQLNEIADKPGSIYFIGRSIGWPAYGIVFRNRVLQLTASLTR